MITCKGHLEPGQAKCSLKGIEHPQLLLFFTLGRVEGAQHFPAQKIIFKIMSWLIVRITEEEWSCG